MNRGSLPQSPENRLSAANTSRTQSNRAQQPTDYGLYPVGYCRSGLESGLEQGSEPEQFTNIAE
jgi:hypothetical protein